MLTVEQIEQAIANKQYIAFKTFSGESIIFPKYFNLPYIETEFEIHHYDFLIMSDRVLLNEEMSIDYINYHTPYPKILNENELYNWVFENVKV